MITWCSLATNHDRSWHHLNVRIGLDLVVLRDHVETVQKLTLILVNTLHLKLEKEISYQYIISRIASIQKSFQAETNLNIEESWGINLDSIVLFHVGGELGLIVSLDSHQIVQETDIVRHLAKVLQALEIGDPWVISKSLHDFVGEGWITEEEPTTWSDTVCLVLELLRPEFVEAAETVERNELNQVIINYQSRLLSFGLLDI